MSLEFRFRRRIQSGKEHEVIDKISNLLSAMSAESPVPVESKKLAKKKLPAGRASIRNNSVSPKLTLFQFSLPMSLKNPVISTPQIATSVPASLKKARVLSTYKPKVPTFIRPKPFEKLVPVENTLNRYKKILSLTQRLIDQDSLKGWN